LARKACEERAAPQQLEPVPLPSVCTVLAEKYLSMDDIDLDSKVYLYYKIAKLEFSKSKPITPTKISTLQADPIFAPCGEFLCSVLRISLSRSKNISAPSIIWISIHKEASIFFVKMRKASYLGLTCLVSAY
jgi:hypothetical protein